MRAHAVDYSFVREIHRTQWTRAQLDGLRAQAAHDSHCDAILRESLLDRDYDTSELRSTVAAITQAGDFVLTSFPDAHFVSAQLLVRSEFLMLRYLGDRQLSCRDAERYCEATAAEIVRMSPSAVIYRCCDYNPDDFSFLSLSADERHRAPAGMRGTRRLLCQPGLLEIDLAIVGALVRAKVPVRVLMPFVRFPSELEACHERLRGWAAAGPDRPSAVGMMLEVPANLYQIDQLWRADFFVFGPSDLLKYMFGGVDRNDAQRERVSADVLLEPIRHALAAIDRLGNREVFFAKGLIGLCDQQNFAQYTRTRMRKLYMPSQLATVRSVAG